MPTPVFVFDLNPNTDAPMQDLAWDPWAWEVFCGQFAGGTIYPPRPDRGTDALRTAKRCKSVQRDLGHEAARRRARPHDRIPAPQVRVVAVAELDALDAGPQPQVLSGAVPLAVPRRTLHVAGSAAGHAGDAKLPQRPDGGVRPARSAR